MLGTETKLDQRAGIGQAFGLPAVIILISHHGVFGVLVPNAGRFAIQIFFANERGLNVARPPGIYLLLAVPLPRSLASAALVRL